MRNFAHVLLLFVIFGLAALASHAGTPQPVQLCPIASNTFAIPSHATDLVRTLNASNVQACVPYSALTSDLKVYGGSPHGWNTQAALGIASYQPPVTPPVQPPVVPPPVTPICPSSFVTLNYTCTLSPDGKLATCTAPVPQ